MSLLLLDADTIIFFHQFGIWDKIVEKNDIHLTSIIAHDEAIFYYDGNGEKQPISKKSGQRQHHENTKPRN